MVRFITDSSNLYFKKLHTAVISGDKLLKLHTPLFDLDLHFMIMIVKP